MIQNFLKTVPLFAGLDDEELTQVLLVSLVRHYREGAVILTEGATGGRLHVIHRGQVRVSKAIPGVGEEALAILGPGDLFGEVEFLDRAPASAHAIAHTPCQLLSLPHEEVVSLMDRRPVLAAKLLGALGRTLAARLRETNGRVASLLALSRVV